MADIFLDDGTKTIGARLTDQEYAIAAAALSAPQGKEGLAQMFAAFLQQLQTAQMEKARKDVIDFVAFATPTQIQELLAIVSKR